jgi:hypothetical protein
MGKLTAEQEKGQDGGFPDTLKIKADKKAK